MGRGVPLSPSIVHGPDSFRFSQEPTLFKLTSWDKIFFANTKTIHVVRASLTFALFLRFPVRKDTLFKTVNSEFVTLCKTQDPAKPHPAVQYRTLFALAK